MRIGLLASAAALPLWLAGTAAAQVVHLDETEQLELTATLHVDTTLDEPVGVVTTAGSEQLEITATMSGSDRDKVVRPGFAPVTAVIDRETGEVVRYQAQTSWVAEYTGTRTLRPENANGAASVRVIRACDIDLRFGDDDCAAP